MQLERKIAVIHGGGGAIGGAVARAFAREGARVYLAGRTPAKLVAVARDIAAAGGFASAAQVDALDPRAVVQHVDAVAREAGRIDIVLNAIAAAPMLDAPLAHLSLEDFAHPVAACTRTHYVTAQAAARHMVRQRAGVILMLSPPGPARAGAGSIGCGVAAAAVEALSRLLAAELAASGVRVRCLRPGPVPVALDAVTAAALLFASDRARAMTRTAAAPACGSLVD